MLLCSKSLKKKPSQIRKRLGILRKKGIDVYLNKNVRSKIISESRNYIHSSLIDSKKFMNVNSPHHAYLLGLLWADGYVFRKGYISKIECSMIREDLEKLTWIFESTGKWYIHDRKREGRKEIRCIQNFDRTLTEYLVGMRYSTKTESASKILSTIPFNLKHYWFRGLIDGDGSFYVNNKNYARSLSVSSSENQNWNFLELLFKSLNISPYHIRRWSTITGNASEIKITSVGNIIKFGEYIYRGFDSDNMGLKRKYEKYLQIKCAFRDALT